MSIDPRKAYREYEADSLSAYTADETVAISGHIRDYIDGAIEANPGLGVTAAEDYLDQSHGDKTQAARLILGFYDFCKRKYHMRIKSSLRDKMPVDVPILRQIEIVKYLHERHTTREIAERFCVSDEIIRKDLRALREGIKIMGAKLQIKEEQEGQERVKYYSSTAHPILLILNLTEIYALTELLSRASANDSDEIYRSINERIQSQLTPYAKDKIRGNGRGDTIVENSWRNEKEMVMSDSACIPTVIVYAEKANAPCSITFTDKDSTYELKHVYVQKHGQLIRIRDGRNRYEVPVDQVQYVKPESYT